MNPLLITSLALAGLVAGRGQRAIIFRYSVPAVAGTPGDRGEYRAD